MMMMMMMVKLMMDHVVPLESNAVSCCPRLSWSSSSSSSAVRVWVHIQSGPVQISRRDLMQPRKRWAAGKEEEEVALEAAWPWWSGPILPICR